MAWVEVWGTGGCVGVGGIKHSECFIARDGTDSLTIATISQFLGLQMLDETTRGTKLGTYA